MPSLPSKINLRKILLIVTCNVIILFLMVGTIEYISFLMGGKLVEKLDSDFYLNHTWKPNSSKLHKEWIPANPDFPNPYIHYYNNQGWLEKYDVTMEKRPGVYRIFYLGDSFTEGTVPMDQSVPSLVEQRLNDLSKGMHLKFEVINTGTNSYSPVLMYLLLRHVVAQYSPDLIIVNVDMTDDFDDWKYRQTMILDENGNPFAAPPRNLFASNYIDTESGPIKMTWLDKIRLFLIQHSHTFVLLSKIKPVFFLSTEVTPKVPPIENRNNELYPRWAWCQWEWDDFTLRNVSFTLDMLKRIASFAKERNIKVMFTAVPHYRQFNGPFGLNGTPAWSSRPHYEIAKLAKAVEVPYLNSFEELKPFIKGSHQSAYYYVGDMHFNPRGYKLWANSHIRFLTHVENSLLPNKFYQHIGKGDKSG